MELKTKIHWKEERRFLMEDVINIGVLAHSEKYGCYTPELFFQEIEQGIEIFSNQTLSDIDQKDHREKGRSVNIKDGCVRVADWFHLCWKQFQNQSWTSFLSPESYGGKGLPKSLEVFFLEFFTSQLFPLSSLAFFSNIAANLIEEYGDDSLKKMFCKELYSLNWGACISVMESEKNHQAIDNNIGTIAIKEQEKYKIKGKKEWVLWGDQDVTENILHILSARIGSSSGKKGKLALFAVPKFRMEKGTMVSNHVSLTSGKQIPGSETFPAISVSYGVNKDCYGYLLCELSDEENSSKTLQDISRWVVLDQVSHLFWIYQSLSESKSSSFLYLKSIVEGLRNVIFSTFFYDDCSIVGGKEQKKKFEHLHDLYSNLFPTYISRSLAKIDHCIMDLIGAAGLTAGNQIAQHLQYIKSLSLLMGREEENALNFVRRITTETGTEILDTLLTSFEEIDSHMAVSESLRETVLIWREYIGGLLVTIDDLKKVQKESDKPLLYSELVIDLLGDLIVCFHLIKQGIEAEKKLLDYQANFFLLKKEAQSNRALRKWYNKLVIAEFFATNVLTQHEGTLKIIQRYSESFTELLPEFEEE